jgi:uncharacterized repeat protein (TIGR03803 family)
MRLNGDKSFPEQGGRMSRTHFSWKRIGSGLLLLVAVFGLLITATLPALAQTETVLYNFCSAPNCTDGLDPTGNLIFDGAGNLYGTTVLGGNGCWSNPSGCGVVFEISPNGGRGWTETVLQSFSGPGDAANPINAPVIFDSVGNLYGTTDYGGSQNGGTVFELSQVGTGWTEAILNNMLYRQAVDGNQPEAGLLMDAHGNLYGTTTSGGIYNCNTYLGGCGVVFELTPSQGGVWTETVLHRFMGSPDGGVSQGAVVADAQGNLYGTTVQGGVYGNGTVFVLFKQPLLSKASPPTRYSVLHSFAGGTDGVAPDAGLAFDTHGNLYGTTQYGGVYGNGTVFEMTPGKNGKWNEMLLYSFTGGPDGAGPTAPLVFDAQGNLYGTTAAGGSGSCTGGCGVVFELTPSQDGEWTETVLHSFAGPPSDGAGPFVSGLIFDTQGNLYGTTNSGGLNNSGTVFEVTP